jgi:hypothetical protein
MQSLNAPGSHYYYDRSLSLQQTAELAAGQRKPEKVAGYVGQVGPFESLISGWAMARQTLCKARIYYPSASPNSPANS